MENIWARIEVWLARHAPLVLQQLQPGATEAQVQQAEVFLRVRFPDPLRESLKIHNGENPLSGGLLEGWRLLSLAEIGARWQMYNEIVTIIHEPIREDESGEHPLFTADGNKKRAQQCDEAWRDTVVWWRPEWVPIAADIAGDCICFTTQASDHYANGSLLLWIHDGGEQYYQESFINGSPHSPSSCTRIGTCFMRG